MSSSELEINHHHLRRINYALQYIDQHLDKELSLDLLAKEACYSPFHFHKLFKTIVGETLNSYINRKRVEKAAAVLFRQKNVPVSEILFKYGFNSDSSFARAFKKYYGVSPSHFRKLSPGKYSKIGKVHRKNGQVSDIFDPYIYSINDLKNWMQMNANIEIKTVPDMHTAYITQIGDDGMSETFYRLIQWARPKGLLDSPEAKLANVYHDSFKVTSPDKVRMSISLILEEPITPSEEVGATMIKGGKYIVGHFEIPVQEMEKSWTSMFAWMNENGYQKSDLDPFEIYHNDFNKHPEKKCILDMYIPIKG